MGKERSKKIAAHLSSLRDRAGRLEDANLQALADICEWQQEQLDAVFEITGEEDPDAFWTRCGRWTEQVKDIVNERFDEVSKRIIHDREAFEIIFKNYFELKSQLDFMQRSLEIVEAATGVDLEGMRDNKRRDGKNEHSPESACSCSDESPSAPVLLKCHCCGGDVDYESSKCCDHCREPHHERCMSDEAEGWCNRCVEELGPDLGPELLARHLARENTGRAQTARQDDRSVLLSKLNRLVSEWSKEARVWAMSSGDASDHREAGIRGCIRDLCEKVLDRVPAEYEGGFSKAQLTDFDLLVILAALPEWEDEYIGTEARNMLEALIEEVRRSRIAAADALLHPTGHCTCAGEGTCDWCTKPCPGCGEKYIECRCDKKDVIEIECCNQCPWLQVDEGVPAHDCMNAEAHVGHVKDGGEAPPDGCPFKTGKSYVFKLKG